MTGTSTSGPITAAKAAPELMPNTAMATAIASSKLLLAAVFKDELPPTHKKIVGELQARIERDQALLEELEQQIRIHSE